MATPRFDARVVLSPGLKEAPVLDRMCSQFVLTLTVRHAARFNLRRDWNSLLSLTARHLVWPVSVLERLRAFLKARCKGNEHWLGHEDLTDAAFMARHGGWGGPYEEGTLFFYIDEYIKDAPKDLLAVIGTTAEWLDRSLKKESTLVEKNIDALAGLLQLNPAERALLLYGTLARYQRDLRGLLVEFKVSNAQEAYAAIAAVAGVNEQEVAEALRAGSRLERTGMVENLISEHNITDLADLMKVSEQLPPVLMRHYEGPSDLMAVFTRPATRSELAPSDFHYVGDDQKVLTALLRNAVARREPGVNVLLYGPPGTGKTELAKVAAQAAGLELYEVEYADRDGNSLSGRDRYRSLQISQVFLKGSPTVALLFDEVEDVFPPISTDAAQLMARLDTGGHAVGQRQRQGLGEPDPGDQPGAGDLGHQPHRADRPGLPSPLPVPPGPEIAPARRPRNAGHPCAGRRAGVRRVRGPAGRPARAHAGPGAHGRQVRPPHGRRRRGGQQHRRAHRAPAGQCRQGAGLGRRHEGRAPGGHGL